MTRPDGGDGRRDDRHELGGEPEQVVPANRLPRGFAERVEDPPRPPARPRPAATIVLMREASVDADEDGLEVLLLRRVRSAGFVPGAWVFPGGRVDGDDAAPALLERLDGITASEAARTLGMPSGADPPAVAYVVAALREAFEETGILVARDAHGRACSSAATDDAVRGFRDQLLADEDAFPEILDGIGCRMDGAAIAYIAHWITPEAEPRRYDTRFFAAAVGSEQRELLHTGEMSGAVWLTPAEALERNDRGELPMVFPTLRTLEDLSGFASPGEVLKHWMDREVPTVLPRLVRTRNGVGIVVDE